MSLIVLAQGVLIADPQQRTSAKGSTYATCTLRVATDDEPALVSIITFSGDAVRALLAHAKGDSLAVTGRAKLSSWMGRDGVECHGLSVVAERVLSVYQVGKQRELLRATSATPA